MLLTATLSLLSIICACTLALVDPDLGILPRMDFLCVKGFAPQNQAAPRPTATAPLLPRMYTSTSGMCLSRKEFSNVDPVDLNM